MTMLGVFPLNIVVLPNESVALHLFEPRYRELFQDHKNGEEFVILFVNKKGKSDYGTTVYIDKIINEFPDGTVDLIVKGKDVVKIKEFFDFYPNKLYSSVEVERKQLDGKISDKLNELFLKFLESSCKKKSKQEENQLFHIANRLELTPEVKDNLLRLKSSSELDVFLINEIRFYLKLREQENQLNNNYHLN